MKSLLPSRLPDRARSLIWQNALYRWENAVMVAGTILLSAFGPLGQPLNMIVWPLLGLVGVGAVMYSSLTNPRTNSELLLRIFQAQFDLKAIKAPDLNKAVTLALEYQRRIEAQVRQQHESPLWSQPEDAANQMEEWITNVYRLALRLDAYRRDTLNKQQLERVPQELKALKTQRQSETHPTFQAELDQLLDSKQKQLDALQALDTRMRQASYQLEQSLAALGTVDSQVQLIDSHDRDGGKQERVRENVKEEVARLGDLVTSINEVYEVPSRASETTPIEIPVRR
jgi:hypothetical protein